MGRDAEPSVVTGGAWIQEDGFRCVGKHNYRDWVWVEDPCIFDASVCVTSTCTCLLARLGYCSGRRHTRTGESTGLEFNASFQERRINGANNRQSTQTHITLHLRAHQSFVVVFVQSKHIDLAGFSLDPWNFSSAALDPHVICDLTRFQSTCQKVVLPLPPDSRMGFGLQYAGNTSRKHVKSITLPL